MYWNIVLILYSQNTWCFHFVCASRQTSVYVWLGSGVYTLNMHKVFTLHVPLPLYSDCFCWVFTLLHIIQLGYSLEVSTTWYGLLVICSHQHRKILFPKYKLVMVLCYRWDTFWLVLQLFKLNDWAKRGISCVFVLTKRTNRFMNKVLYT